MSAIGPVAFNIAALGMVTSVGAGVATSCAALRAGLSRAAPDKSLVVEDPDDMETHPFVCSASPVTDGFVQTGRWIQLANEALHDVSQQEGIPAATDVSFWRRTALLVLVPEIDHERFGWPLDEISTIIDKYYVGRLSQIAEVLPTWQPGGIFHGNAGFAAATLQARTLLERTDLDRVLILAVDSFIDPLCLMSLVNASRLKSPTEPAGLIPGEAAACVLLEREDAAVRRGALALGRIRAARYEAASSTDAPLGPLSASAHARAGRLVKATSEALGDSGISSPFRGDIILDLNGEQWKALAWGTAQAMLSTQIDFARCNVVLPCGSFGEIGAASGAAGVCVAARSFVRGYASSDHTLVLSLGERGDASAVLIARPGCAGT